MATIQLHPDFKDFLRSLNDHKVEYLVIGGYAVAFHGYPRPTGDLDVWVRANPLNASLVVAALRDFGFATGDLNPDLFLPSRSLIRMGYPPYRIEISTQISGVQFEACWIGRVVGELDGLSVPILGLMELRANKLASGRPKDLADLDYLPGRLDDMDPIEK
ncbi:hypothetical protein IV102_32500 [bacterium]|nr:hypothetical protein [bacterium]